MILFYLAVVVVFVAVALGWMNGSVKEESRARRVRPSKQPARAASQVQISIRISGAGGEDDRPRDPLALAKLGDHFWVRAGRSMRVSGRDVPGGMLYVGSDLPSVSRSRGREPALIDPKLDVGAPSADPAVSGLRYWPSYSEISPKDRATYLTWLAGGRSDPRADVGFVFLFFYGLERRLLFDLRHLPDSRAESLALIAEVERLRSIYGANGSFSNYSSGLAELARMLYGAGQTAEPPELPSRRGSLSTDVRVALGKMVATGVPVPGEWAMAWVTGHPETRLGVAAKRCPEQFRDLFLLRFRERFGEGMRLKPNKTKLRVTYRPASASFSESFDVPVGDVPDVGDLTKPLRDLREIAETAASELESFARFVSRNSGSSDSVEALSLLPRDLAKSASNPELQRLRGWAEERLWAGDSAIVEASEVMDHWRCARADRVAKGELAALAKTLEATEIGIEPDPRFGGSTLPRDQKAVLFRMRGDTPGAMSSAYRSAALLLHLAAAVATSDGTVTEEEEQNLERHLELSLELTDAEVRRLRARVRWLIACPPTLARLTRWVESVDERGRQHLAQMAVLVANADGRIDPEEVVTLSKIYKLLGQDPERAYSDIYSLRSDQAWQPAGEPVTVRPPAAGAVTHAIPQPLEGAQRGAAGGVALDMDKVARTVAATAEVSKMLAQVFSESEPAEPLGSAAPDMAGVCGLDASHTALLRALENRSELSREEFDGLATGFGLLANGAIETLNEAAFECANAPLLEDGDAIEVDLKVLAEMLQ